MRTALLILLLSTAINTSAAVTATIVDEDGKPIAGATAQAFARETRQAAITRVLAGKPDAPPVATAQSAANGSVRLDVGKNPVVMLLVTAQGRAAVVDAADGDDIGPVILPPSSTSKGKVTAGGKPVAGALVAFGNRILGRTNAEGIYEVPESALSSRVLIVHPDYAISETPLAQTFDRELSAGVAIRGRVLGADGKPVAHAALSVEGNQLGESGDDGSFAIAHAPADWTTIVARTATLAGMAKRSAAPSIDVRLRPAALVSGVVRDMKSQTGVAGMRLTLTAQHDMQQAITDAKGAFSFPAMTAGGYEMLSTHPAFYFERARTTLELAEGRKETRTLGAVAFGRVRGSVIDDERKPVAAAVVTSIAPFSEGPRNTATTAAGEFTVRMPEAQRSMLHVTRSGYAGAQAPVSVAAGETKSGVTITLHRGFPLHVQVEDADRTPLRGVAVNFMRWNDETGNDTMPAIGCNRPRCNMTDASGAVDLRLAEGRYDIFVAGETIVSKRQQGETITARSSPLTINVERGAEVSGRVVYGDGSPAPNVTVRSMSLRNYAPGATTDASGAFTIRNARRGHDTLMAEGPNRTTIVQKEVDIPAAGVVLTLPKSGQISGRVTDAATKQPITTFTVTAVRRGMGSMPMMSMQTPQTPVQSEDGTFTVDSPSGAVEVQVTAPGYARGTATGIDVEDGKTVSGVEVHLERGAKVSGKVTSNGAPVSGVTVSLGRSGMPMMPSFMFGRQAGDAATDANGDYTLDSVPPGDQTVVFGKNGYVSLRKNIEAAGGKEARLDVELSRGSAFSGRVVDEAGRPVADADVRAQSGGANVRTDAEGAFRLEGIADARTTLLARKQGYVEARLDNADASAAVTLTLRRGGTITGRVVGLAPDEFAMTTVMAAGPGEYVRGRVEPDGRFTLQGVSDGRVSVSAAYSSQPPRQSASKMVDVVDGSAPPVELDFGGFTVRGHVTRGGKPVDSGNIVFQPMDRTKQSPASVQVRGPAGEYVAAGLTAGEYKVVVYVGPTPGSSEQLTVTGDMTHDINVRGGVVRGRVVDAGTGAPVSGVSIAVDPMMRAAVTDSDGRFVVDVGEDTVYHLHTQKERYAPASQDVTVAGGVAPDVELRIAPAEGTLVSVVDAASRQGVDASVFVTDVVTHRMVFSGMALAGEDGMVRVYAAPGTYEVGANARGYAPTRVTVPLPGAEVRLELRRGGTVVVQSRSNAAIKGMLVPEIATGRRIPVMQQTTPNVPAGSYTLEVGSSKYPVIVVEGQTVTVAVE